MIIFFELSISFFISGVNSVGALILSVSAFSTLGISFVSLTSGSTIVEFVGVVGDIVLIAKLGTFKYPAVIAP